MIDAAFLLGGFALGMATAALIFLHQLEKDIDQAMKDFGYE